MDRYRRNFIPGGSYFFTVSLHDRQARCLTEHIDLLRAAFRDTQRRYPFSIDAIVILPEHLHAIWTLPNGDADYPGRWRHLKGRFTRALHRAGVSIRGNTGGEGILWQPSDWEHSLRDAADRQRHVDYIHFNPVRHGHVAAAGDWPYSSFHRHVRQGLLPVDWASSGDFGEGKFGE